MGRVSQHPWRRSFGGMNIMQSCIAYSIIGISPDGIVDPIYQDPANKPLFVVGFEIISAAARRYIPDMPLGLLDNYPTIEEQIKARVELQSMVIVDSKKDRYSSIYMHYNYICTDGDDVWYPIKVRCDGRSPTYVRTYNTTAVQNRKLSRQEFRERDQTLLFHKDFKYTVGHADRRLIREQIRYLLEEEE